MKNSKRLLLNLIFVLLIVPQIAYAYLDPGTISSVISLLMAAFIGMVVYIKVIWEAISSFFKKAINILREIREFGRFFWSKVV